MSDLIRLDHGVAPWLGTADATVVAEYRYYDIPLAGVVAQGSMEYVFWCATRADEDPTCWIYVAVTADQRCALEDGPVEGFNQRLEQLNLDGLGMMALATENLGIVDFEELTLTKDGISQAYSALLQRLDALSADAHQHAGTLSSTAL
jgi:hypothetical protein